MHKENNNGAPIGEDKTIRIKLGYLVGLVVIAFALGGSVLAYKLDVATIEARTKEAISIEAKELEKRTEETYARKDMVEAKFEIIIKQLEKINRKLGI
jgi:hypothetical protein